MNSRRSFLKAGLLASSALALESCTTSPLRETPEETFGGKLACLGTNGTAVLRKNLRESSRAAPDLSILNVFDFSTMTATSAPVPIDFGHSVTQLSPTEWLCAGGGGVGWGEQLVFINPKNQEVLNAVRVGPKFGLSGHIYVDQEKIVAPLSALDSERKPYPGTVPGKLLIVDRKTQKQKDLLTADGVFPHEVQYISKHDLIAVSYYGEVRSRKDNDPTFFSDHIGSKVVFYNAQSMAKVREVPCPRNAFFNHFSVSESGTLYLPTVRFAKLSQESLNELESRSGQKLLINFLNANEFYEKKIALPEPVVVIDAATGASTEIMPEPLQQRRAQSAIWHKESDSAYITYPHSDSIMRVHEQTKKVSYFAAHELGLYDVRGVAGIRNANLIAAVGGFQGVVVFNPDTGKVVQRFNNKTYWAVHLFQV